jgi:prepilin-type N-terminal cleavage/methylation domain-containing protein
MLKKTLRNQKGFTLIEIIAVLVILGILAAVAVPKFLGLQESAHGKALQGAIAALQSTATMDYSRGLLNGMYNGSNGPAASGTVNVGDYWGTWGLGSTTGVLVTVTGGPTGWDSAPVAEYPRTKTFNLY